MKLKLSRLRESRSKQRITVLLLSILAGMCVGIIFSFWDDVDAYYWDTAVLIGMAFQGIVLSILYCTGILIVILTRDSYHPAWDVTFDLIGWGLNFTGIAMLGLALTGFDRLIEDACSKKSHEYNIRDCSEARGVLALGVIAVLCMFGAGVVHFVLLVKACIGTHRLRQEEKQKLFLELNDGHPKPTLEPDAAV